MSKEIDKYYKLIPMSEITDEAREVAVRWAENNNYSWIGDKHKLASDIMNYAKKHHESELKKEGVIVLTEQELKTRMFSAFMTGQNDVIDKNLNGTGVKFEDWYKNNYDKK